MEKQKVVRYNFLNINEMNEKEQEKLCFFYVEIVQDLNLKKNVKLRNLLNSSKIKKWTTEYQQGKLLGKKSRIAFI